MISFEFWENCKSIGDFFFDDDVKAVKFVATTEENTTTVVISTYKDDKCKDLIKASSALSLDDVKTKLKFEYKEVDYSTFAYATTVFDDLKCSHKDNILKNKKSSSDKALSAR